ncbi:leucine-rich repeat-containing protein 56 isoform X1 [Manis pentadactyla]|uniref:leucine-rich repeat-containing protein 56 isoform X1 n=1 Tax=Manis pentadactyla TaxID=143292 RepID=UPI00255CB68E|nr:leucine-rich repeat-containing protein 56 isoform X1 [Manis pentadactyla]XP_057362746.1 leucine-rich repeat-containing protein 56 isoform X1 [Manis pentadactyla]
MDQAWDGTCGPRPSTASVQVRELSWQGLHNPCPQSKDRGSHGGSHCEPLVEYLSPARLQALAQVDDLRLVSMLEMCVNTRDNSLGTFGVHLPNLRHLKLNGSCLGSVRDLGTSLGHLQVLWLARCGLTDLDGIGSFPALKELYVSYNDISDLSPLCLLEQLEVLDLEGNSVEGLGQLRYLQLCPRLATLTLEGNLVCLQPSPCNKAPQGYNYRAEVRKLMPQLQVLDEVPAMHTDLPASWKLDRDWLMVKEAIKEGSVLDSLLPRLDRPHEAPIWGLSPELSLPETQPQAPRPWPLSLLVPGDPVPKGLLPEDTAPEDDTSNLTHGAGPVLCGNPTKGLRERRHKSQAWAPPEQLPPYRLEDKVATLGSDPADSHDLLALAGLQAWREQCLRRCLESQQEGMAAPWGSQRGPEEQEGKAVPNIPQIPLSLVSGTESDPPPQSSWAPSGTEPSRISGYVLLPPPHKLPRPPESGSGSWWSTDLQFWGRRLRALGSLKPGPGQGLAAVTALKALAVAAGPSPQAQGCPGPTPAPGPVVRPPGLQGRPHLSPITPAQSHP